MPEGETARTALDDTRLLVFDEGIQVKQLGLGISTEGLTLESLRAHLAGENSYEADHVEFKSQFPTDRSGMVKAAKAVTSFANSSGGILVYGVREENDRFEDFSPVPLGEEADRVMRSIETRISPRIDGLRHVPIEGENGKGVLLVVVPASATAPHCAKAASGALMYARRVGRQAMVLDEHEVERAYLGRWEMAKSALTSSSETRGLLLGTHDGGSGNLWMVATPLSARGRAFLTGHEGLEVMQAAAVASALSDLDGRLKQWFRTTRFRRVEVKDTDLPFSQAFVRAVLHDTGAVGFAQSLTPLPSGPGEVTVESGPWGPGGPVPSGALFGRAALIAFVARGVCLSQAVLAELNIGGGVVLQYGLQVGNAGAGWLASRHGFPEVAKRCDHHLSADLWTDVVELDDVATKTEAVGRIATDIMSGFGFEFASSPVAADGAINLAEIRDTDRREFTSWCQKNGVLVK